MHSMNGYVDLHCHFLPKADDGVATLEESLICLRAAKNAGFDAIVLSRHQMAGVYDLPGDRAREGRLELQKQADDAGIELTLHDGAEHYLDEAYFRHLDDGAETLAGGLALLVELPVMAIPPVASEAAFRTRLKGITPILAHVERYREVADDPRKAGMLADMGYLLQVNLGSLAGLYGRRVAKAARYIIENDLAFCAASDAHGPKMLTVTYEDGLAELRRFGDETVDRLLGLNPRRVVNGEVV